MAKKKDVSVIIMVLVIVAVAVLGGFAVAPTIGNIISQRQTEKLAERISDGTATVSDLADREGMQVDEFLAKYEVSADKADGNTGMSEFSEMLTLKNYCTFSGMEYSDESLEAYKTLYAAAQEENADEEKSEDVIDVKDITADTKDMNAKYGFIQYLYAMQQQSAAETVDTAETTDAVETVETDAETANEAE